MDGYLVAGAFLVVVAFLLVLPELIVRFGVTEPGERPESFSERNHRLDAEALHVMTAITVHDCGRCGERCDTCGDRMCAEYGPEPVITCDAHRVCVDCDDVAFTCTDCATARALAMIEELS